MTKTPTKSGDAVKRDGAKRQQQPPDLERAIVWRGSIFATALAACLRVRVPLRGLAEFCEIDRDWIAAEAASTLKAAGAELAS